MTRRFEQGSSSWGNPPSCQCSLGCLRSMSDEDEGDSQSGGPSPAAPPPPPRSDEAYREWLVALRSFSGVNMLKIMLDEISRIPFKDKKKKHGTAMDNEIALDMVQEMVDILTCEFLHVDFESNARDIEKKDWGSLQSCRRSDSGTVGTIFLQFMGPVSTPEIVVAKAITTDDFSKTDIVNRIATQYFGIKCPAVRLILRSDPEFDALECAVKQLFLPLNEELYNAGGHLSPKDLFSSQGVLLLEFVRGKPLCHRTQGQRPLTSEDYYSLGKLFLLDLLIRNTDRLPCARAMPRPGSKVLSDHGNAGNIMFGSTPGEVWSIDPDMQIHVDEAVEATYAEAVEAVTDEIVGSMNKLPCFQALSALYYAPILGMKGLIDSSLHDLKNWSSLPALEHNAVRNILSMIRLRVQADLAVISQRTGGRMPPEDDNEKDWREWMRLCAPRTVVDVLEFLELYTGFPSPAQAEDAFCAGFIASLEAAAMFKVEVGQQRQLIPEGEELELNFILRMICRVCDRFGGKHAKR